MINNSQSPPPLWSAPKIIINQSGQTTAQVPKSRARKVLKMTLISIGVIIVILSSIVGARAINVSNKIFVGKKTSFYKKVADFIRGQFGSVRLIGENLGQINILLLGIGGEGHDGGYLTDTIILAQIRPDINKITLTAIPRDYLVDLGHNLGDRKINAAFAEGFARNKDFNEAGEDARAAVEKISGLTIPYFAVIDFKGFEKGIDLLNGVDIQVDRTFTDYQYPDSQNGYLPPLTFNKGLEHMNGERALQFARSRHALGPEGSDFARSQRQQKILQAVKIKVVNLNLITDSGKINNLFTVVGNHFHTNISPGEIYRLYDLVKNYSKNNIISLSLDPQTNLICPKILESNGAYILTPCPGKTTEDVKNFFRNSFTVGGLASEHSIIWLADSTHRPQAYTQAEQLLASIGATVYEIGFSGKPLTQTVVHEVNRQASTLEFIHNSFHAVNASLPPPGVKVDKNKVDVVLVLGADYSINPVPNIKE